MYWVHLSTAQDAGPEFWQTGSNAIEKPKLDDARRLRGIYLNDAEDGDFKETVEKCTERVGGTDGGGYAL